MNNGFKIINSTTNFDKYFAVNSISKDAQNKLSTTDFLVVPSEYKEN